MSREISSKKNFLKNKIGTCLQGLTRKRHKMLEKICPHGVCSVFLMCEGCQLWSMSCVLMRHAKHSKSGGWDHSLNAFCEVISGRILWLFERFLSECFATVNHTSCGVHFYECCSSLPLNIRPCPFGLHHLLYQEHMAANRKWAEVQIHTFDLIIPSHTSQCRSTLDGPLTTWKLVICRLPAYDKMVLQDWLNTCIRQVHQQLNTTGW